MNGFFKNISRLTLALSLFALTFCSCTKNTQDWSVTSPSGNIRFTLTLADSGKLFYSVDLTDSGEIIPVINRSPLGLVRNDGSFAENLRFVEVNPVFNINEAFDLPAGKQKHIENQANELTVTFRNAQGQLMQIISRIYNDGAAFRYAFPEGTKDSFTIDNEITAFTIAGDGKAWIQPFDRVTDGSPAYETFYTNAIPIGTPSDSIQGWAFPALFKTTESWVLITESAVDSTYFAAHLQPSAPEGMYSIRMPEAEEAMNLMEQKPTITLPWRGPWRTIIIGTDLSTIVESNMVVKLAPESKMDASWVKPGRASWSWWSDPPSPRNYNSMIKFIDLASEMGWEYFLVDANWDQMSGGNVEQFIRYANSKNVGILLWYNSGGPHNVITERPRDLMLDPAIRKEEFRRIAALGVKGVKVDFFQSDKADMMKLYLDILKDAAENKILVNFHGCTLPRGWNRTWPNLVSMEAVTGAENYQYNRRYPEAAVWHNTILPFTRNVVGSMDYTPVAFSYQRYQHLTTYGHELALSVVFESAITHFADGVETYRNLPEAPKEFLMNVPTAWDETLLLDGEPGKFCIMARRSGNIWYLGGINGTMDATEWEIDLSRLEKRGIMAEIIADGTQKTEFSTLTTEIKEGENLKVKVLPAGGFVAVLKQ